MTAKPCERDVATIKELRSHGLTQQKIADRYSVNQVTISGILSGRLWKTIPAVVEI